MDGTLSLSKVKVDVGRTWSGTETSWISTKCISHIVMYACKYETVTEEKKSVMQLTLVCHRMFRDAYIHQWVKKWPVMGWKQLSSKKRACLKEWPCPCIISQTVPLGPPTHNLPLSVCPTPSFPCVRERECQNRLRPQFYIWTNLFWPYMAFLFWSFGSFYKKGTLTNTCHNLCFERHMHKHRMKK